MQSLNGPKSYLTADAARTSKAELRELDLQIQLERVERIQIWRQMKHANDIR